jgi:hypothetical protein
MKKYLKIKGGTPLVNIAASMVIHLILFFIISFIVNASSQKNMIRSVYVQVTTGMFTKEETGQMDEEEPEEAVPEPTAEPVEPPAPSEKQADAVFYSLTDTNVDTTGLKNIYMERTLGVKIKYPSGWNFIDQNVKSKLDGVTFWGLANIYDPPPYIHLEVKEKYLFNPARFKYNQKLKDYTIYYNDPEEMSDQYTQIIYIRTEDDEDYSLKLIMKGKEPFKTFQPVFFGMLKTFTFGE